MRKTMKWMYLASMAVLATPVSAQTAPVRDLYILYVHGREGAGVSTTHGLVGPFVERITAQNDTLVIVYQPENATWNPATFNYRLDTLRVAIGGGGGGGTADGVVTGTSINTSGTVTTTRSVGADLTYNIGNYVDRRITSEGPSLIAQERSDHPAVYLTTAAVNVNSNQFAGVVENGVLVEVRNGVATFYRRLGGGPPYWVSDGSTSTGLTEAAIRAIVRDSVDTARLSVTRGATETTDVRNLIVGTGLSSTTSVRSGGGRSVTLTADGGSSLELHTGSGAPASSLGADGDWFLNQTTGTWLERVSGAWVSIYTDMVGAGGGITLAQAQGVAGDSARTVTADFAETGNTTAVPIAKGGTGATDVATARDNLGVLDLAGVQAVADTAVGTAATDAANLVRGEIADTIADVLTSGAGLSLTALDDSLATIANYEFPVSHRNGDPDSLRTMALIIAHEWFDTWRGDFLNSRSYDAGDRVTDGGDVWTSLTNNNVGNTPTATSTQWQRVSSSARHIGVLGGFSVAVGDDESISHPTNRCVYYNFTGATINVNETTAPASALTCITTDGVVRRPASIPATAQMLPALELNDTTWTLPVRGDWATGENYPFGTMVNYADELWVRVTSSTGGGGPDGGEPSETNSNWVPVSTLR